MMGRYKVLTGEFADLMLGYYGETIGPRDRRVVDMPIKQTGKPIISGRPADLLKPEWHELRDGALALEGCNGSDEDVLTFAMFPKVAPPFFKTRAQGPKNLGKDPNAETALPKPAAVETTNGIHPPQGPAIFEVKLSGRTHKVTVTPVQ